MFNKIMKKKRKVIYIMCFAAYTFYIIDWEKNVEEEGTTHASFKKSSNSRTFDLLYEMYKLLSRTHGDQKSGKVDQW